MLFGLDVIAWCHDPVCLDRFDALTRAKLRAHWAKGRAAVSSSLWLGGITSYLPYELSSAFIKSAVHNTLAYGTDNADMNAA